MYTGNLIFGLIATSERYYRQVGEQFTAFVQFDMFLPCWHPDKPKAEDSIRFMEELHGKLTRS